MRLKTDITLFMMGLNKEAKELEEGTIIPMPKVTPRDFSLPSGRIRLKNKQAQPSRPA